MAVQADMLGLVHDLELKGAIMRHELRSLMREALPFGPLWQLFEAELKEEGDLVALESVRQAAESVAFLHALPEPFHGRSQLQNINLIKVATYLVANRLLSPALVRQSVSIFTTYAKLSPFRRFEANLETVSKALRALSVVLSEKGITAWLDSTAPHRGHEMFLVPHEFLFLVSNATKLAQALQALPPLELDLKMRENLFNIDPCTKTNPIPRVRAQAYLDANSTKVRLIGASISRDYASKRTKACEDHLAKSGSNDLEEFKSLLWDKELARRVKETVDNSGRKKTASVLARRYRELCEFTRATRSQASSPTPVLRKGTRRVLQYAKTQQRSMMLP